MSDETALIRCLSTTTHPLTVFQKLGEGAYGKVYKVGKLCSSTAEQSCTKFVAVKVQQPTDLSETEEEINTHYALQQLTSGTSLIPPVIAYRECNNKAYTELPLFDGDLVSLGIMQYDSISQAKPDVFQPRTEENSNALSFTNVQVQAIAKLCETLGKVYKVIHGDLKLENILYKLNRTTSWNTATNRPKPPFQLQELVLNDFGTTGTLDPTLLAKEFPAKVGKEKTIHLHAPKEGFSNNTANKCNALSQLASTLTPEDAAQFNLWQCEVSMRLLNTTFVGRMDPSSGDVVVDSVWRFDFFPAWQLPPFKRLAFESQCDFGPRESNRPDGNLVPSNFWIAST